MAENNGHSTNDELISQFMAFSGSTDPEKAASYLEMCGNNVETAVGLFMEHEQGGREHDFGGGGGNDQANSARAHGGGGDDIRAPDETRTMRLMDDDHRGIGGGMIRGLSSDPAYHLMSAMMDMEEQMTHSAFASAPPQLSSRAILDAAIAAQAQGVSVSQDSKENEEKENIDDDDDDYDMLAQTNPPSLSDIFAPPNHLMHRAGGFQGARTMAKDTRRWLLVNIQRDAEFASHALNRDVWRDELVENLVREGFIFWQVMDGSAEGRTYTERYQVHDYPHISIIDPRTGRLLWRKEGWTQENPVTAETFAEAVTDFCSRNSFDRPPQAPRVPGASAAPSRPAKRSMDEMSEAEQLRAAMQASMAGAGTEDDDGDVDIEYIDDDDEVQVIDEKLPAATEDKEPTLNDELQAFVVPDEPNAGNRVQLRLPGGKRAVRMFSPSDPVRAIYAYFAQSNDEARGGREFALMAGFPPRDLLKVIDDSFEVSNLKDAAVTVHWK